MPQKNREKWTVWDYLFSWSFIGTCLTLNNPIDMIRFRLQVMPLLYQQGHLFRLYKGCFDCGKKIYKHQGPRAFFKGNLSNILRIVPSQTLVWEVKQLFQRNFHYHESLTDTQHIKYNTLIGITSSLIVSLSLYPLQYIRQLILNRTDREGRSIWHYIKKTIKNNGITGMYKGALNFSIGAIIFRGSYFGIYDSLKVKTVDQKKRWAASFIATYISIMNAYPLDTIRRRFVSSRGKYTTSLECLRDIWTRQGIRGLYLGWPMVIFQSVNAATIFFFYDRLITDYEMAIE